MVLNSQNLKTILTSLYLLNSQFTSVFTTEHISNIPDKGSSPFVLMDNITISHRGVLNSINRLNEKKAFGPDKIPIIILKRNCQTVATILQCIFKLSLNTGVIPADWKTANVVSIFKKGDRSKPANYQPVSLTSVVSKMLEHNVVSNIMRHLDSHNILNESQHGIRQKRSCETQLLLTTDDLSKNINSGKQVDMAILDFSKAFDKFHTDDYLPNLTTMEYCIIQNSGLTVSYLGRSQKEVVQDASSAE